MTMDIGMKISPENLIGDWGYTEDWAAGTSVAPSGWSMVGTAGSVSRETSIIKYGQYSMKITAGASGVYAAELPYTLPIPNGSFLDYQGRTITFGMWVQCSSASKARIYIDDGINKTYSSYHSGGGTFEFLTVTVQIASNNNKMNFGAEVSANGIVAYFSSGIAVNGETIFTQLQNTSLNTWGREVDISPSLKAGISSFDLARREGIFIGAVKMGEKNITMSVQLFGATFAEARGYYDTLVKGIVEGQKDLYIADDRILKVYCTGISKIKWNASFAVWMADIIFLAQKPYEQYISKSRVKQTITVSPTTFTLPYLGSFKSRPVIQLVAGASGLTSMSLTNFTTAQVMAFSGGTVTSGLTMMVDCENQTVQNNGVDSIANFSGQFFTVVPGTNYFQYAGSTPCTLLIDYFNRYL